MPAPGEYAALPALHNFAKRVGARQRALNHLFVVQAVSFGSTRRANREACPNVAHPATRCVVL
jgi:hypothetical protein